MKQQEVVKLSNEELNEQLVENKKKYNELKMAHAVSPLENPIQIKAVRKSIASVEGKILKTHLEECIKDSLKGEKEFASKVEEIIKVLKR